MSYVEGGVEGRETHKINKLWNTIPSNGFPKAPTQNHMQFVGIYYLLVCSPVRQHQI